MKNILKQWFSIDLRALALFRIGLGLLILADLWILSTDVIPFYSDEGLLPRQLWIQKNPYSWIFSFHLINGSAVFQYLLFLIGGLLAFLYAIGWRVRAATFFLWIFLISLQARNGSIVTSGDTFVRMLLFWSIFLPTSARYSVDSLYRVPPPFKSIISVACIGFLSQVLIVYGFAIHTKWMDPYWVNGEQVFLVLSATQFTTPLGAALSKYPHGLKLLNHSVLWFETLGPLLLFMPIVTAFFRILVIPLFIFMHIGFGVCMGLGNFPWISSLAMLPFTPSVVFDKTIGRLKHMKAEDTLKASVFSNVITSCFLVLILLLNLSVKYPRFLLPAPLRWLGGALSFYQDWDMFATAGNTRKEFYYKWLVVKGLLKNGKEFDLLRHKEGIDWSRPSNIASLYKNIRWNKYIFNLSANEPSLLGFGWHWCREWNRSHLGDERLRQVQIYSMLQRSYPTEGTSQAYPLHTHACFIEDVWQAPSQIQT